MRRLLLATVIVAVRATIAQAAGEGLDRRIAEKAQALEPQLIACRRDLHQHPELSNREERTARVVADKLRALGLDEVREHVGGHGVTALLHGGKPGPTVAVRADMDALPIAEPAQPGRAFRSQSAGAMHACGHDLHVAVGLGVAEVLSSLKADLPGAVLFLFQGAEEGPPAGEEGGARLMVKEGALAARPEALFALHSFPDLDVGQIAYAVGPAMATSDRLAIEIRGKRAHGAAPQLGVDAITTMAEAVLALQTIVSRKLDPLKPAVLTLGTVEAGERFNILAERARLTGTLRTLDDGARARAIVAMRQVLNGVALAHDATASLTVEELAALTYNEPALVEESLPALKRALGDANVRPHPPLMPAEDFSYFTLDARGKRVRPGFYFWLGVGNRARGIGAGLHTADFDLDERALVIGVRAMATLVADHLSRHSRPGTVKENALP